MDIKNSEVIELNNDELYTTNGGDLGVIMGLAIGAMALQFQISQFCYDLGKD